MFSPLNTVILSRSDADPASDTARGVSSGRSTPPPLDGNVIAKNLESTFASPSWKVCVMEGTTWTGTAEEHPYISVCFPTEI